MKAPVPVAVLVSGGGTNLQALLDAGARGEIRHGKIALVLSDRKGAYALERAKKANIPALAFDRKELGLEAVEAAFKSALEEHGIKIIVLAGFLSILSSDFIRQYEGRILNVHPSLIPAFCGPGFYGLKVHEAALSRGVKLTGATVHLVNEEADGGPILQQKAVKVLPSDTPQTLQKRVMEEAEWVILPQCVEELCMNYYEGKELR
ncbi:MAG: phosphoribosylglycinamide formyltransferase [Bacillota bacterium]|nr:phosphoribosylglycinamide formyltransferase [Bacillota bacterium]